MHHQLRWTEIILYLEPGQVNGQSINFRCLWVHKIIKFDHGALNLVEGDEIYNGQIVEQIGLFSFMNCLYCFGISSMQQLTSCADMAFLSFY